MALVGGVFVSLSAQSNQPEVYSSAGYSDSGYQSWTIGEPMVESYQAAGSNWLTQGFHQPELTVVAIEEPAMPLAVKVFPIPTLTEVFLEFPPEAQIACEMELTSIAGQVLARRQYDQAPERTQFDLTGVSAGVYLITVFWKDRNQRQVFRVEKIQY